ncbi:MAG: hypothetical protein PHV30_03195 [Candidatus Margulisbacteria bacterium]|nr:hypothetical protein [Candidatus Margulisiibacteriota bacterium]
MKNKIISEQEYIVPADIQKCLEFIDGRMGSSAEEILSKIFIYKQKTPDKDWPFIVENLLNLISMGVGEDVDKGVKAICFKSIKSCLLNLNDKNYETVKDKLHRDLNKLNIKDINTEIQEKWEEFLNSPCHGSNIAIKSILSNVGDLLVEVNKNLIKIKYRNFEGNLSPEQAIGALSMFAYHMNESDKSSSESTSMLEFAKGYDFLMSYLKPTDAISFKWEEFLNQKARKSNALFRDLLKTPGLNIEIKDNRVTIRYSGEECIVDIDKAIEILGEYALNMNEFNMSGDSYAETEWGRAHSGLLDGIRKGSDYTKIWENFLNSSSAGTNRKISEILGRLKDLHTCLLNDQVEIKYTQNEQTYSASFPIDEARLIISKLAWQIDNIDEALGSYDEGQVMSGFRLQREAIEELINQLKG